MKPIVRLGDINSHAAPVIATKAVNVIAAGSPVAVAGSIVAPHDSKPTHFSVTTTISPRVLISSTPTTSVGSFDTCFHTRITGAPNILI